MYKFSYHAGKEFYVTPDTINFTPHTFDRYNGIWEKDSIEYFFNRVELSDSAQPTIIDIGAQSGLYSLYAKFIPNSTFYSYEPLPLTFNLLKDNIELNSITNVNLFNYAIGKEHEMKVLHVPDHLGLNTFGDTPLRFDKWKDVDVQIKPLDDLFLNIPVHFIKCDTEGWEYNVIQGAQAVLKKWRPELFIEVNDTNLKQCGTQKDDLLSLIYSLNYKLVNIIDTENYHFVSCV